MFAHSSHPASFRVSQVVCTGLARPTYGSLPCAFPLHARNGLFSHRLRSSCTSSSSRGMSLTVNVSSHGIALAISAAFCRSPACLRAFGETRTHIIHTPDKNKGRRCKANGGHWQKSALRCCFPSSSLGKGWRVPPTARHRCHFELGQRRSVAGHSASRTVEEPSRPREDRTRGRGRGALNTRREGSSHHHKTLVSS